VRFVADDFLQAICAAMVTGIFLIDNTELKLFLSGETLGKSRIVSADTVTEFNLIRPMVPKSWTNVNTVSRGW
jgi:hypothetical protein